MADQDELLAVNERLRNALEEIVAIEAGYEHQEILNSTAIARKALATTPSAALEELKRKCWEEGAEAALTDYGYPSPYEPGRHDPGWSVEAWVKKEAKAIAAKLSKPADGKGE